MAPEDNNGWVDVNDELPGNNIIVELKRQNGFICEGYKENNRWVYDVGVMSVKDFRHVVTHWRYIQKLIEEESC